MSPEYGANANTFASAVVDDWIFFAGGTRFEFDPTTYSFTTTDYATTFFLKADGTRLMDPSANPAGMYYELYGSIHLILDFWTLGFWFG